jgi:gluconate kinase
MLKHERVVEELPPVLCLIGLQAGGKTSDAKLITAEVDGIFFDGDDAIPKDSWMKWQVAKGLPVTSSQVQHYIEHNLIPALLAKRKEAANQNKPLIVSQGLFFNKHRQLIQRELGGNISFLVVDTPPALQAKQIEARCAAQRKSTFHAWREKKSVMMSNSYFEKPDSSLKAFTIRHLGKGHDKDFLDQFKKLPCYADVSRHLHMSKHASVLSSEKSSATTMLSALSKPVVPSEPKDQTMKSMIPAVRSYNPYLIAGSIATLAAIGIALFTQEGQSTDPDSLAKMMNSTSLTL